ncbi:hypothetical protein [Pseudoleptotrichia goodfellowii]|uniref:Uncharacterized protein n=1 Tax=Pseudoleptotrichia goodfellowii TaxID=157692 RepID=A0A510JAN5_9FUSO|nr:hypothetical protein [Pseudoleptotrichia goodfellowii]BBM36389.1 hypothetical protein JCM16774_1321 [Pseudoleptotrichia goodfellowii]
MSLDPKTILSPKGKVENIEIIEQNTDYTIAILSWEGKDTIAARWNPTEENTMGIPQSRGYATWFILPDTILKSYLKENTDNPVIKNSVRILNLLIHLLKNEK